MKLIHYLLAPLALALTISFTACNKAAGTLTATIEKGAGKVVSLNRLDGRSATPIASQTIPDNGSLVFDIKDLQAGVYTLVVENRIVMLALDGTEKKIEFNGDFNTMANLEYTVSGSTASAQLQQAMKKIMTRQMEPADFQALIGGPANPHLAATLTFNYLPFDESTKSIHEAARDKIVAAAPNSTLATNYQQEIKQQELMALQRQQQVLMEEAQPVKVGAMAPEISAADPDGQTRTLSSLRGKVVILEFWASWCGPCRRFGNPELVRLHKKFSGKEFAIFNVALERAPTNDRWIDAIKKDNLVWPDHVIDRSRVASMTYGVRSIPRNFVLDKEGRITGMNLHGPELEAEVAKLLEKGGEGGSKVVLRWF